MKPMLKIGAMCVLSLLGSQLNGAALNDETLISELLNGFKESVLAQDTGRFESLFHSDAQTTTRQNVREVMTILMDSDALYNLELPIEEAKTVINDDGTATVFPVKIRGPNLNVTERFTLVKEEGSWLVSNIEIIEGHWLTVRAPADS
jgi:hypothetical protein